MVRYSLRLRLIVMTACALALSLWLNWDLVPGTFYRDANGFPQGSGTTTYNYDNGQLMLKEWYRAGLLYRATWYRPDGSEIATEEYDKSAGGTGYYLRQDGTIRSMVPYSYSPREHAYSADGNATSYREDGNIEKVVRFKEGVAAEP